jgi:hypothetical protein
MNSVILVCITQMISIWKLRIVRGNCLNNTILSNIFRSDANVGDGESLFLLVIIEKVGTLIELVTLHVLQAQKTILMRKVCSLVINFSLVCEILPRSQKQSNHQLEYWRRSSFL